MSQKQKFGKKHLKNSLLLHIASETISQNEKQKTKNKTW